VKKSTKTIRKRYAPEEAELAGLLALARQDGSGAYYLVDCSFFAADMCVVRKMRMHNVEQP